MEPLLEVRCLRCPRRSKFPRLGSALSILGARCSFHGPDREYHHPRHGVLSFLIKCGGSYGTPWKCQGQIGRRPWVSAKKKDGPRGCPRQAPDVLTSGPNGHVVLYLLTRLVHLNGDIDSLMAADPPGTTKCLNDSSAEGGYILNLASLTFLTLMQCYSLLSVRLPLGKVLARKFHRKKMSRNYPTN
jgi:hypothetical protein